MGELEIAAVIGGIIPLLCFVLLTRERRNKRLRIGFLLEREKFEEKEALYLQ